MTFEKLQVLVDIYNNLRMIHTNGDDSFIIVDNLRRLQNFIMQEDYEILRKQQQEEQKHELE